MIQKDLLDNNNRLLYYKCNTITIPRNKEFEKNYQKNNGSETCLLCGRILKTKNFSGVRTWYGSDIVTEAEAEQLIKDGHEGGDTGCWLIGSDCLRRHPEIKPYIL